MLPELTGKDLVLLVRAGALSPTKVLLELVTAATRRTVVGFGPASHASLLDKIVASALSAARRLDVGGRAAIFRTPVTTTWRGVMTMETFTNRSNARRKANKMMEDGTAPATEFEIEAEADGRFAIAWKPPAAAAPNTTEIEREIQTATSASERPPAEAKRAAGTRVMLTGTVVGCGEENLVAVDFDGGARMLVIEAVLQPAPTKRAPRAAAEPRRSKARELDEQAARGVMPVKPDVTSHANHHYQKRFDRLAELAAAGDWNAVQAYECNGVNTYAKMVRQYRDRLVSAHAAQQAASSA